MASAQFTSDYSIHTLGVRTGYGRTLTLQVGTEVGTGGNSPAAGAPVISGTAHIGETLTADSSGISDANGLSGVTFSYQWLSSRDTEIQGATGATYTLVSADEGNTIKVRVTFTDDGGTEETLTSAPTATVNVAPTETVRVTAPASVPENTEAAVTMSFGGLAIDHDTSDTGYIFRADVVGADECEGGGMGRERYIYHVDEDPEVRTGTISTACPPGDYTVEVSISSRGNVELALATADFTVNAPGQQQPEPLSTDATLSGLTQSDVTLGEFDPTTTGYTANVAGDVTETTVTPTTNDDERRRSDLRNQARRRDRRGRGNPAGRGRQRHHR